MDSFSDGQTEASEGQRVPKSALVSRLGWVEGEDTILGKKEPVEQNGKCAFDTDQWTHAQTEIFKYDKGLEKLKW